MICLISDTELLFGLMPPSAAGAASCIIKSVMLSGEALLLSSLYRDQHHHQPDQNVLLTISCWRCDFMRWCITKLLYCGVNCIIILIQFEEENFNVLNKEFVKKIAISVQWNSSNWLALLARSVTQGIKYPRHDQGVKQQYVGRPTESQFGLISDKYLQSFYANFLVRSQLAWIWQLSLRFVTINKHAVDTPASSHNHPLASPIFAIYTCTETSSCKPRMTIRLDTDAHDQFRLKLLFVWISTLGHR